MSVLLDSEAVSELIRKLCDSAAATRAASLPL